MLGIVMNKNAAWLRAAVILVFGLVLVAMVLRRDHQRKEQNPAAISGLAPAAVASQPGTPTGWVELGTAPEADAAKIQKALAAVSIETRMAEAGAGVSRLSVPTREAVRAHTLANEESVLQGLSFTPPAGEAGPVSAPK